QRSAPVPDTGHEAQLDQRHAADTRVQKRDLDRRAKRADLAPRDEAEPAPQARAEHETEPSAEAVLAGAPFRSEERRVGRGGWAAVRGVRLPADKAQRPHQTPAARPSSISATRPTRASKSETSADGRSAPISPPATRPSPPHRRAPSTKPSLPPKRFWPALP